MSAPGFTRTRRSASAAAPPDPPPFYLDLNTMEWKRRAPRSSVSPVRRRRRRSSAAAFLAAGQEGEVTEYQSCGELCTALKEVLLGTEPKIAHESVSDATRGTRKGKGKGKAKEADDGLKVAQSGVLLVADDDDDDEDEDAASENAAPGTCIFRGSWAVFGDPSVTLDDGLVLKKLHEVVRGIDAYVTRLEQADFIRTMDDPTRTTTVSMTVPCCCITLRSLLSQQTSSSEGEQPQCAGEMVVSVAESQAERSFGTVAMALRMTVVVVH
ncbi:hypothetical protein C2E23DRAFT_835095 [Lenzites betulinus]|nr:hypothetical protein C2E23DRAFT_835095 [Lenzites betulinus]